jgi:SAM-dependent methyltransferase
VSIEPRCIACGAPRLDVLESAARCRACGRTFEVRGGIAILVDGRLSGEQSEQVEKWEVRHEGSEIDWGDRFDPSVMNLLTLRNRRFLDRLSLGPQEAVMEVGCSTGKNLRYLSWRTGVAGYGVDIALAPLVNAVEKSQGRQRFFVADAERLPFEDGSFAGLLALDVLEHLPDAQRALGEWARVVRVGGLVALSVPINEVFPTFAWWRRKLFPRRATALDASLGHHVSRFPRPPDVKNWMAQVGLRPVFVEFRAALFEPLWDFVLLPAAVGLYSRVRSRRDRSASTVPNGSETGSANDGPNPMPGGRRRRLFERLAVRPGRVFGMPDRLLEAMGRGSQIYVLARKG